MPARNPDIQATEKFCLVCGVRLHLRTTRDIERKQFCSHSCRGKVTGGMACKVPPTTKTCAVCEASFRAHPKAGNAMYCSTKCLRIAVHSTQAQYDRMNAGDSPERYIKALLGHKSRRGLSIGDLMVMWGRQQGRCAVSGVPMTYKRSVGSRAPTNASIDRILAGGPYVKNNVRLVCAIVNKMRLDLSDADLYFWCERILGERNAVSPRLSP